MVLISTPMLILAWIMAGLLLAISAVILINIFDFPPTLLRHVISFLAAFGVISSLIFILASLVRRLDLLKHN